MSELSLRVTTRWLIESVETPLPESPDCEHDVYGFWFSFVPGEETVCVGHSSVVWLIYLFIFLYHHLRAHLFYRDYNLHKRVVTENQNESEGFTSALIAPRSDISIIAGNFIGGILVALGRAIYWETFSADWRVEWPSHVVINVHKGVSHLRVHNYKRLRPSGCWALASLSRIL